MGPYARIQGTFSALLFSSCFLLYVSCFFVSCAGYPPAGRPETSVSAGTGVPVLQDCPPESPEGLWLGRSAAPDGRCDGIIMELRLFPDGSAFLTADWAEDGRGYAAAGSYRYNAALGKLWLDIRALPGNLCADVSGEPAGFAFADLVFLRISDRTGCDPLPAAADLTGTWWLPYDSAGDPAEVTLIIHAGGSFTERTIYAGGEDLLTETGSWILKAETSLAEFHYDRAPEADFTALFLPAEDRLSAPGGNFLRSGSP